MIFTGPCLRASRRSPGAPSIDGTQSRDRGRLLLACSTLARFARHPCRSPRVVPFLSIGADHLTGCRGLSLAKGASIDFCNQLPFTSTRNPSDSRASRRSPLRDPARLSSRWCRAPFSARLRVTTSVDAAPRASIRRAGPLPRSSFWTHRRGVFDHVRSRRRTSGTLIDEPSTVSGLRPAGTRFSCRASTRPASRARERLPPWRDRPAAEAT